MANTYLLPSLSLFFLASLANMLSISEKNYASVPYDDILDLAGGLHVKSRKTDNLKHAFC